MKLATWYKGLRIPHFNDSRDLENFCVSMMSTFSITSGGHLNVRPTFSLTKDIDTAAIDLQQNSVMISSKIISNDHKERPNPAASVEEAITTIFGMIFHESMHFVCTSRNIESIMKGLEVKDEQLFLLVNNILEDYYIDNEFMKTMPMYQWTYDARFRYFFSTARAADHINVLCLDPSKVNMLNVLISMKNPESRYMIRRLSPEFAAIVNLALTVLDESDREKRPLIAYEVYKLLLEDLGESTPQELAEAGQGDGDQIVTTEQMQKMEVESTITSELQMCSVEGEYTGGVIEVVPSPTSIATSAPPRGKGEFRPDVRYNEFTKLLKARSETSHFWTPPNNTGRSIRHVSRIAVDNKIFSTRVVETGIGPQEVILLLDCSASMENKRNIQRTIEAGYAAAMSLEAGRHGVAVYGHTADHPFACSFASTVLYRFKAFDEKFESVKQRFIYTHRASEQLTWNNDDEVAILQMGSRFTKQKNSKTLIVISDGMPSSSRNPTIKSTRTAVEGLRAKGIKVVSISISEDAVEANNDIYGRDWNVSNSDPNVVIEVIRKIAHF